jgi:hypothetical protein
MATTVSELDALMSEACCLERPEESHPLADDALCRLVRILAKGHKDERTALRSLRKWEKADKYYGGPRK